MFLHPILQFLGLFDKSNVNSFDRRKIEFTLKSPGSYSNSTLVTVVVGTSHTGCQISQVLLWVKWGEKFNPETFYCIRVEAHVCKEFRDWRDNKGKQFNTQKCLQSVHLSKLPSTVTDLQPFGPFITNCQVLCFDLISTDPWSWVSSWQGACDNPASQPSVTCTCTQAEEPLLSTDEAGYGG